LSESRQRKPSKLRGKTAEPEMPVTFEDLPPDHPIFTIGPSFVFRSELPAEDEEHGNERDAEAPADEDTE
jgi:hypothetical protein